MSLLTIKVLAIVAIFAVAIIGGLIPLLAARHKNSRRFFSLGNAFAGGLFLGVGFIHLLPAASEKLRQVMHYPLAALLATLGLTLLLLIDRVMFGNQAEALRPETVRSRALHPYILLLMLSFHSVITGASLGLESEMAASLIILLGILCHKGSASFALMVNTHVAGVEAGQQKVMLTLFSLMTPAGVLLGSIAATGLHGETAALMEGSFNALAAGTFIYVAIIGIIDEEFVKLDVLRARFIASSLSGDDDVPMPVKDKDRVVKFLLITAGVAVMGLLAQEGIHGHGGHDEHIDRDDHQEHEIHESHTSSLMPTAHPSWL